MSRHIAGVYRTSRGRVCCDMCGRTIARGARYWAATCADGPYIWTWRECPARWSLLRSETETEARARRCREAEEADGDPARAWGAAAWAAFRWRMSISPAMHPAGVGEAA